MSAYSAQSICFVIPKFVTYSTGGAEIQVHYLTRAFMQRGWKVEVVCAGLGYEEQIKHSPYYTTEIKYHYYRKKNIRSLEFLSALKALKKTNCRYYYQRTDFALTASTLWFTKKNKRKMIYAVASDSDAKKDKYRMMFKHFSYNSWFKKAIRGIDFYLLDKMMEWAKRNTDFMVCQNNQQLLDYKTHFKRDGCIIPNSFIMDEVSKSEKENVVLWVGNNNPIKRPELFVEMAQRFKNHENWRFVMIGSASELIQCQDLSPNLHILGSLSYQETNQWFAKASVFVNTSLYEGMPNTFIQSWCFKVLILSLSVNPDGVFKRDEKGFWFNNDLHALDACLHAVIQNEINTLSILTKGEDYFKKRFDINENVLSLIDLIES